MKILQLKSLLFTCVAVILFLSSCKPDPIIPPDEDNEEEIITTLILTLTDSSNNANTSTATFRDIDGIGGNPATLDTLVMKPNTTYYGTLTLLDESKSPVVDISKEVLEEANDHYVFYVHHSDLVTISTEDQDNNNPPLPLGLKTKWRTHNSGETSVEIILKHQPGIKKNDMNVGETDIDVIFQTKIQ